VSELARLETRRSGAVHVARVTGELDLSNARELTEGMGLAVADDVTLVVLDLSGTTYLDSAGIQVIFDLAERLSNRQQQFRVAVPEGARVRRVLDIVRLEGTVPIDASAKDAETEIRAKA
jgi:anti-anti-sigma factor